MKDFTTVFGNDAAFKTTSWGLVRSSRSLKALDSLVSIYWKPLYFYVRRRGYDNETAKDLVQGFFSTMIERGALTKADPARGKFRTFLLAALVNFIKDCSKGSSRLKRGGGQSIQSLDFAQGEAEFAVDVSGGEPPEKELDRDWARCVWKLALTELKGEPAHLEAFKLYLDDADYSSISAKTGLSEGAAKTAVHRLKGQLREIIVGHIESTLTGDADLGEEIGEFMELLSREPPAPSA